MTWTRTGTPVRAEASAAGRAHSSPAHPGEQRKAQVVNEVERGDRDAVVFEPCVRDAGARASGRLVVQLGVAGRGGVRTVVVDDGGPSVAGAKLDGVVVELVVAQLDRLAQRVPAL